MQLIPDYQPQGEEMNKQILTARYWLAPSSGCHLVGEPETENRTHDFPSSMILLLINRPVLFILNLLVPVHSISAFSILPGPSELAASPAMDAPLDSLAVDVNPPADISIRLFLNWSRRTTGFNLCSSTSDGRRCWY